MSKHTLGPWELDAYGQVTQTNGRTVLVSGVASPMVSTAESIANARLIAAAPELLGELKRLRLAYVGLLEIGRDRIIALGGQCDQVDVMERADPALKAAAAAIAKAEGYGL